MNNLPRLIGRSFSWLAGMVLLSSLVPLASAQGDRLPAAIATTAVPLVTTTPRANGCTVHIVAAGQTLWAIALAYGVKVDDIRGLNSMGAENVTIYPGQTLIIRCLPQTPTAESSLATTTEEVVLTPTRVTPTRTLAPARTVTRTATPDADKAEEPTAPGALVAGLLILSGGTLVVLLFFGLMRRR